MITLIEFDRLAPVASAFDALAVDVRSTEAVPFVPAAPWLLYVNEMITVAGREVIVTGAALVGDVIASALTVDARYGPTKGPPSPTGTAPAGWMKSVLVSATARGMLIRPLPVSACVPAGSAVLAMR